MTNAAFPDAALKWNKRFQDPAYIFGTEPNAWLRAHAGQIRTGRKLSRLTGASTGHAAWRVKKAG